VLLFSGARTRSCCCGWPRRRSARRRFPFPLDARRHGTHFGEVIEFRDRRTAELGERLIVASVQESIDKGRAVRGDGAAGFTQPAADGDAARRARRARLRRGLPAARRRDEERARAKERMFSFRDDFGQWDPKEPAPGAVNSLTTDGFKQGENVRVFPLSNWTELDVWEYIDQESLEVPSIYFATSARCSGATECCTRGARASS